MHGDQKEHELLFDLLVRHFTSCTLSNASTDWSQLPQSLSSMVAVETAAELLYYKRASEFPGLCHEGQAGDGRELRDCHRHKVRSWVSAAPRGEISVGSNVKLRNQSVLS